jgi:hypothetical protein
MTKYGIPRTVPSEAALLRTVAYIEDEFWSYTHRLSVLRSLSR